MWVIAEKTFCLMYDDCNLCFYFIQATFWTLKILQCPHWYQKKNKKQFHINAFKFYDSQKAYTFHFIDFFNSFYFLSKIGNLHLNSILRFLKNHLFCWLHLKKNINKEKKLLSLFCRNHFFFITCNLIKTNVSLSLYICNWYLLLLLPVKGLPYHLVIMSC